MPPVESLRRFRPLRFRVIPRARLAPPAACRLLPLRRALRHRRRGAVAGRPAPCPATRIDLLSQLRGERRAARFHPRRALDAQLRVRSRGGRVPRGGGEGPQFRAGLLGRGDVVHASYLEPAKPRRGASGARQARRHDGRSHGSSNHRPRARLPRCRGIALRRWIKAPARYPLRAGDGAARRQLSRRRRGTGLLRAGADGAQPGRARGGHVHARRSDRAGDLRPPPRSSRRRALRDPRVRRSHARAARAARRPRLFTHRALGRPRPAHDDAHLPGPRPLARGGLPERDRPAGGGGRHRAHQLVRRALHVVVRIRAVAGGAIQRCPRASQTYVAQQPEITAERQCRDASMDARGLRCGDRTLDGRCARVASRDAGETDRRPRAGPVRSRHHRAAHPSPRRRASRPEATGTVFCRGAGARSGDSRHARPVARPHRRGRRPSRLGGRPPSPHRDVGRHSPRRFRSARRRETDA